MGVDCEATLPPGMRARDIATVLGIAAGLPWERRALRDPKGDFWYVNVPGVLVTTTSVPEMVEIVLNGLMVDGQSQHTLYYHFEWEEGETPGCTGLKCRSTPFWIAVMLKVVERFGGSIDFNDCDTTEVDRVFPVNIRPASDGKAWQDYQIAIASVIPVTQEDLIRAKEWASYT